MNLPIEKLLTDVGQRNKAGLQDQVVEAVYTVSPLTIMHGGTAIWRCYNGNRFSDDIDMYLRSEKEVLNLRNELDFALKRYDAHIGKATIIGNTTIFIVKNVITEVKLEVGLSKHKLFPIDKEFEKVNGSRLSIITLTPEAFVLEKINAYNSRRYIRDIYDIYHLSSMAEKGKIGKQVCRFLTDVEKPVNESVLSSIVYAGAVPTFEGIVNELKRRFC